MRGDDVDDPNTFLVAFGESKAKYMVGPSPKLRVQAMFTNRSLVLICLFMQPLPAKLLLRKKRARDGKSSEEVEQFPVPRSVTVRRRPNVAVMELRDEEDGVRTILILLIIVRLLFS